MAGDSHPTAVVCSTQGGGTVVEQDAVAGQLRLMTPGSAWRAGEEVFLNYGAFMHGARPGWSNALQ